MAEPQKLKDPWLVAVWPGMGNVAVGAGSYLIQQLGAQLVGEFAARELFDVQNVEVKHGIARSGHMPRNLVFLWEDPAERHDLLIFLAEAQPSHGGYAFCHRLLEYAQDRGVKRFITFAAMATQLHPTGTPRVFAVATERPGLDELKNHDVEVLEEGQISGLNGVLLAAGAERDLAGACLLGELPFFAVGVPNPKASRAVLGIFSELSGIDLDLDPLLEESESSERVQLELLEKLQRAAQERAESDEEPFALPEYTAAEEEDDETAEPEPATPAIDAAMRRRIESMFDQARQDRAKAFELKHELDRLGVFKRYEDRFLDLFKAE
jgi:proteasome assembly chaperone (PAC2) family protein